jgi:hypothetical protein
LPNSAHHFTFAPPVAMAFHERRGHPYFLAKPLRDIHSCTRFAYPPRVALATQRLAQFFLQDFLDEAADAVAYQRLDAVPPAFTNQHVCCIPRHWRYLLRRPLTAGFGFSFQSRR